MAAAPLGMCVMAAAGMVTRTWASARATRQHGSTVQTAVTATSAILVVDRPRTMCLGAPVNMGRLRGADTMDATTTRAITQGSGTEPLEESFSPVLAQQPTQTPRHRW